MSIADPPPGNTRLPLETLTEVLRHAKDEEHLPLELMAVPPPVRETGVLSRSSKYYPKDESEWKHIPRLVCKYWHLAYEPIFYHKIELDHEGTNLRKFGYYDTTLTIPRTPAHSPASHVKKLALMLSRPYEKLFDVVCDIIQACHGIRSLTVFARARDVQFIFKAANSLKRLETLIIGSKYDEPTRILLQEALSHMPECPLKELVFGCHGIGAYLDRPELSPPA